MVLYDELGPVSTFDHLLLYITKEVKEENSVEFLKYVLSLCLLSLANMGSRN